MQKPLVFKINQAKVILYPISQFPSVSINIYIKAGSWYETGPQWGAFHYLEHLIFQGSKKYPNNQKIEKFKQENGISFNGSTGGSDISFGLSFPDFKIDKGLELFEQLIFNPIFDPVNFSRELSVINQEYCDHWDSPQTRFYQKSNDNILGTNNFLNRNGIGQPEFIKTLTQLDLLNLHQKYFQPQNMTISIAGNFDAKKTKDKLTKILSTQTNSFKPKLPQTSFKINSQKITYQDKVDRAYLVFSWIKKYNFSFKERLCLDTASFLLARSTSSILFQKLRQELGLVYDINSGFSHSEDINFFEIWSSSEIKNIKIINEIIQTEIKKFTKKGINKKFFNQIQQFMNYRTLMEMESIKTISDKLGRQLFYNNQIYLPQDIINIANKITLPQFIDITKKIINPQDTIISIMTPIKPEH